ncbi:MAG: AAA family ATPase [Candidatus Altiarchaeota archaeon]|nr:AAA family ATPase [Candidatus Altiarchaeota archaeon]
MTDKLFEPAAERGVFKNLDVLSPHYVPGELPHRLSEAKAVSKILSPVLRNEKPGNIFIYGSTGTGKTSVVRHVIRELERITSSPEDNKAGACIKAVYMNCRTGYGSKYQILLKILSDDSMNAEGMEKRPLEGRRNKGLSGLDPTQLFEKLKNVVSANNISLIVVLDEIDMVKDVDDLMYLLTRINDEISPGRVSIIGISNRTSFKEMLDARSRSTLCEEELIFRCYSAPQLETILAQRADIGLYANALPEGCIKLIAALGAQTNGDARYALKLLQKSGELAESEGRKSIKADDVKAARRKVEEDIMYETVKILPENQQVVLYSIADLLSKGGQYKRLGEPSLEGVAFSGEVYEHYQSVSKSLDRSPVTMRWFRDYLNELQMLGLVLLEDSGKGVRGKTTLIKLGRRPEDIKGIVEASLGLT